METTVEALPLLNIFPYEVWSQVFERVEDVSTYDKVCESSPFFQTFPVPDQLKTKLYFSRVLPLLVPYLKRSRAAYLEHLDLTEQEAEELEDFGHNFEDRSNYREVLKLRKFCRDWSSGVDSFLEDAGKPFQFVNDSYNGCRYLWFQNFLRPWEFDTFHRTFDNTHHVAKKNPFLAKSVYFHYEQRWKLSQEKFIKKSLKFLQKYGSYIRHCAFHLNVNDNQKLTPYYHWISDALKRMPNLKTVSIHCWCCNLKKEQMENALIKLQRCANLNPMPNIKSLQSIRVSGDLESIGTAIVNSNPQITMLNTNNVECLETIFNLKNLTELSTQLSLEREILESWLVKLQSCLTVWKISKLDISFYKGVSTSTLFNTLEKKFGDTLKELRIYLSTEADFDNSMRLSLPNLETLEVSVENVTTVDFILPMKQHLRELSVRCELNDRSENRKSSLNKLQFFECSQELHKSNIWHLFPRMQRMKCFQSYGESWSTCCRDEWRTYVNSAADIFSSGIQIFNI